MAETGLARRIERLRGPFDTSITLPGSKSIALRHILMALLADAPSRLEGVPRCDDVDTMFAAATRLGARVERRGRTARVQPQAPPDTDLTLDLNMSGVSLRLLLAHAASRNATTRFTGHPQLHRRPNADLLAALEGLGCAVEAADGGRLPIVVTGPARPRTHTTLRAEVTSQYLSGLLLAAPALPGGLTIHIEGELASASYVGVTRTEMARRGVPVREVGGRTFVVPPSPYTGGAVRIEGDASAATYHAALATLHRGRVRFPNLGDTTTQGDFAFLDLCERAGARVERGADSVAVQGPARLDPIHTADCAQMPDAAPTLMALAPFLPAPTRITGLATLRVKECDRLFAGTTELRKAGVRVDAGADAMTIHPPDALRPATFDTYEDHRMAMALSVLASGIGGCAVRGPDCVRKTYADYWDDFARIESAALGHGKPART